MVDLDRGTHATAGTGLVGLSPAVKPQGKGRGRAVPFGSVQHAGTSRADDIRLARL